LRGAAAFEPRPGKPWLQVAWKTVGRGGKAELDARALALEMERQEAEHGERFLFWHMAGERPPRAARLWDLREEDIAAFVTA
jgi:hypothetical protein